MVKNHSLLFTFGFLFLFALTSVSLSFAQSEGRDGNNYSPNPPGSNPKPEKSTYSDRYRERYSSDNYRDRNSGENYRETAIEEGFRRRHEPNSGRIKIRYDHLPIGATLGRPPAEVPRDMAVEIGEDSTTFYSGKGIRLPLPHSQSQQIDPLRRQRLYNVVQPPALLQQYVNQSRLLNASQAQNLQPQPVGEVPLGFQQPRNNTVPPSNRFIPPVNQRPVRPNNDLPSMRQQQQAPQNGALQNSTNFLPYPLNIQQRQVNQRQYSNRSGLLNTRPFYNQRNPRLNQRYQPVQQVQNKANDEEQQEQSNQEQSNSAQR